MWDRWDRWGKYVLKCVLLAHSPCTQTTHVHTHSTCTHTQHMYTHTPQHHNLPMLGFQCLLCEQAVQLFIKLGVFQPVLRDK